MKEKILIVLTLTFTNLAFAGSYNFECSAYHLDRKSNIISKLSLTREGATLDNYPGLLFDIVDPNINLFEGTQSYVNTKAAITLKANVKMKSNVISLSGNIGPRDHIIEMSNASIMLNRNGENELFTGNCTQTTISSCGGSCDQ